LGLGEAHLAGHLIAKNRVLSRLAVRRGPYRSVAAEIEMRACFFAKVRDRSYFNHIEFYGQDIKILRDMGFEVICATRWREIPWDADLYFTWWWTWAFLPLIKAGAVRRPTLVTGVFNHKWSIPGYDYYSRPVWQRGIMRFALRRADANVFVSRHEFESVPACLGVNNPNYVPLAVDTEVYRPEIEQREDLVLTIVGMRGANAERKCVLEILRAIKLVVAEHPSARFVIAGEKGSYFHRINAMVRELKVDNYVEFPGIISRERKMELLQRCKVYLQPSVYEGFGLAILEAMSSGAAVVSSPVGAVPEVLGSGGLYIDARNPVVIAAEVNRLLGDAVLREDLGRQGRKRAETIFSFRRRRNELERIITPLMQRR